MKHVKWKNICLMIFAFVFSSTLFADNQVGQFDDSMLVAQQSKKSKKNKKSSNANRNPNTWKPYYIKTKTTEPITSFYQQTVGVGFLYFSDIKGNLNSNLFGPGATPPGKNNRKLVGHIGYNRTPITEFIIGRDIWYWLKIAMSYTHQGGVVIQTQPQAPSALSNGVRPDLTAHLRLDAALFRVYFMCPYTMVWKNTYFEPYLSAGVGPGWQTWADIKSEAQFSNALRMKVSANCVFTIDLGTKLRKAMPTYVMSFTTGCKFTYWGQARSIGDLQEQYATSAVLASPNGNRQSFSNPLRIRTVYQFAPYIGVQFNF